MTRKWVFVPLFASLLFTGCQTMPQVGGWKSLFDGKTLTGWKASDNQGTFTVKDGMIVAHGPRSHLFYVGPVNNADFKNFEFKADVMTTPGSNSGIYFHTEYQDAGWPAKGFECQIDTSHTDPRRTGRLYAVKDVMYNSPSKDNKWFKYYIKVEGRHVIIKIDGKTTTDWTQPENWVPPAGMPGRKIGHGTFALQGHDPKSIVYFKNIMVRPLP